MREKSPDLEEVRDAINDIVHEDNRAGDVIARVRNLLPERREQVRAGRPQRPGHLDHRAAQQRELIGRRIEVGTDLAARLPATFGDPVKVQQVLLNLFMNAMDAMAFDGAAAAAASRSPRARSRAMRSRCGSGIAGLASRHSRRPNCSSRSIPPSLTASDWGLTISLDHCSGPWRQAERGQSTAGSGRGRGFVAAGAGVLGGGEMMDGMFTVFLVDDDAGVLKALSRLLRAKGYDVRPFASAEEFLEGRAAVAGCAVFDVAMPGLDGLALQQIFTAGGNRRPVIFLTGKGDIPKSVRAIKAGAIDFLTKPVNDRNLLDAIARAEGVDARTRQTGAEVAAIEAKLATLTPREREVLSHVIAGRLNKQIAGDLGTMEKTIKVHRGRMTGEARRAHDRRPGAARRKSRHQGARQMTVAGPAIGPWPNSTPVTASSIYRHGEKSPVDRHCRR